MDKKKTILQMILLAAVILGVLLAPSLVAGGTTLHVPSKAVQMPGATGILPGEGGSTNWLSDLQRIKNSQALNFRGLRTIDGRAPAVYDYPNAAKQIFAWKKAKDIVSAVANHIGNGARQVIHTAGNLVSKARQIKDSPLTLISEKILTNPTIARFAGVQYHERALREVGYVSVYLVDSKGLFGLLMDRVIGIFGYPKAAGGTLYPIGIFINVPNLASGQYCLVENHEYCHYYQQSIIGFGSWLSLYSSEILVKDLVGGDVSESYMNCSWEVAANNWAQMMVAS